MPQPAPADFEVLLAEARDCRHCAASLPHGPRPVFQLSQRARILITSQAPGSKVHRSGVPFDDPSGERLRGWMGVTRDEFYDAERIAILPTGLCYPGRGASGDAPPRRECAPLWRDRLLAPLTRLELTLLVGGHAQDAVLGPGAVGERVARFRDFPPDIFPLPHPSWRVQVWMRDHPWFEAEVVPELRRRVRALLE